jgi:hypothetical protein
VRVSQYTIQAGTGSRLVLIHAHDPSMSGQPVTGLTPATPGASAAYVRDADGRAVAIPLLPGKPGEHAAGGFVEVDAALVPGLYQLGLPDEMLAEGATRALLHVRFDGVTVVPVEVTLVAYDPLDDWCMGVVGLANRKRHEFLRRALPGITEMELELGRERERELTSRLGQE